MDFEWDEAKRWANIRKHQVDFGDVLILFDGRPVMTVTREARNIAFNEVRFVTTGQIDDRFYTVVWTQRDERVRIISGRSASDEERRAYRAIHGR